MSSPARPNAPEARVPDPERNLPDAIRARIDPAALQRIPEVSDASFRTRLAEVLQNARRAGATEVRLTAKGMGEEAAGSDITPEEVDAEAWFAGTPDAAGYDPSRPCFRITVEDNGCGINRPEALLSFGSSGWQEHTVADENPAGMGLASLAGCGAHITSRVADGPAWSVRLTRQHFTGTVAAEIVPAVRPRPGRGTTVTFPTGLIDYDSLKSIVSEEIEHYPVTVRYARSPRLGGFPLDVKQVQTPFLADCEYREEYRGLTLGLVRDRYGQWTGHRPTAEARPGDLNMFGRLVSVGLPGTVSLDGNGWQVIADVSNCPDLKLVLPDRNAAIQNAFVDELREEARCVLYRGLGKSRIESPPPEDSWWFERHGIRESRVGPVYVTDRDWTAARERGIELKVPPADLYEWRCPPAGGWWRQLAGRAQPRSNLPFDVAANKRTWCISEEEPALRSIGEIPDLLALQRALHERGGDGPFLVNPRSGCADYAWHRELPTVTKVRTHAVVEGTRFALACTEAPADGDPLAEDVDRIEVSVTLEDADGTQRTEVLEASVAFRYRDQQQVNDAREMGFNGIALVRGHRHDAASILEAAMEAFYDDRRAYGDLRPDLAEFTERLQRQITTRLASAEQAAEEGLARLAERAAALLPPGHEATITVRSNAEPTVSLRETADGPVTRAGISGAITRPARILERWLRRSTGTTPAPERPAPAKADGTSGKAAVDEHTGVKNTQHWQER